MTPHELAWVAEAWNALARQPGADVWRPGAPRPFEVLALRTVQGLHLAFANGTVALLSTPGFCPVDKRRPSRYAPLPLPLPEGSEGYWLCKGEIIDAYDTHAAWLEPADALAAHRRVLAVEPDLAPNGWRRRYPAATRARQVQYDADHARDRAELDAKPEDAAAHFRAAYAFLSVAELVPGLVPARGWYASEGRNMVGSWLSGVGLRRLPEAERPAACRAAFLAFPYITDGAVVAAAIARGWAIRRCRQSTDCRLVPDNVDHRRAA